MGLDIGVVSIEYLKRPSEPAYSFLKEVPFLLNHDRRSWSGGWESNFFLETDRRRLLAAARYYARQENLTGDERRELTDWVNNALPWKDDVVMLQLDW